MNIRLLTASLGCNNSGVHDSAFVLTRGAVLFFLVILPFGHNAALKNFALLGMLIGACWLISRRQLDIDWRSPILLSLFCLLLVMAVSAALGTDPTDSFSELRKHFLPGILLFLLIPVVFQGEKLIQLLLSVIALSFLLRAVLTLIELAYYLPNLDAGRSEGRFIKGFSLDSGVYIPVMMSLLLIGGRWRWLAPLCLLLVLAGMLLVQSRTPVAAALIAVTAMLFVLRKWRILMGSLLIVLASGVYLGISQPEIAERFAKMLNPQTYTKAFDTEDYQLGDGFSGRTPIWFGVLEISAHRPWIGYGFGWKKLASVALEDGYVARWGATKDDAFAAAKASYFSQQASTVNPHNLYLQIYFESGLLGLAAYLLMVLILFAQAARMAWCSKGLNRFIGAMAFAYLIDHVILGLANGLLIGLGPSLALIALLEAARRNEKSA